MARRDDQRRQVQPDAGNRDDIGESQVPPEVSQQRRKPPERRIATPAVVADLVVHADEGPAAGTERRTRSLTQCHRKGSYKSFGGPRFRGSGVPKFRGSGGSTYRSASQ